MGLVVVQDDGVGAGVRQQALSVDGQVEGAAAGSTAEGPLCKLFAAYSLHQHDLQGERRAACGSAQGGTYEGDDDGVALLIVVVDLDGAAARRRVDLLVRDPRLRARCLEYIRHDFQALLCSWQSNFRVRLHMCVCFPAGQ